MRLFSYKLTDDTGFAPNPFWGFLTLATCKPGMRRAREEGDWIAGFTSTSLNGDPVGNERLVYLMRVADKLSIAEYFEDERFAEKIPNPNASTAVQVVGDNIYRPLRSNARGPRDFEQLPNPHHWDGRSSCDGDDSKQRDISGCYVLIATEFAYFGRNALAVPEFARPSVPSGMSRYGTETRDEKRTRLFIDYVLECAGAEKVIGPPYTWPDDDRSWKQCASGLS